MRLALIGSGGHAKVVCSIARRLGWQVHGYFDDFRPAGTLVLGLPVLGKVAEVQQLPSQCWIFVAIGDNARRRELFELCKTWKRSMATLVDPSAQLDETVTVGDGTVIMPGVVVNVDSQIGSNCILNTSCSVDHDGQIASHAHLCPGVHLAGTVSVGEGCMLGTGTSVIPGIKIGARTVVGAGAVVVRDLGADQLVVGVPARSTRV